MFPSQTKRTCIAAIVGASLVVGGLAVASPAAAAAPSAPDTSASATPRSTFTVTSPTEFVPGQPVTLTGTAVAGERITISLPRFENAAVATDANGTWTYQVEQEWDASPHAVTFERSFFPGTIDHVLVPQGSKAFAVSGSDTFTPGERPTFSGTGAIGDLVSVVLPAFEGKTIAKVGADGTWRIAATTVWDASPQKLVFSTGYTGDTIEKTYSPEGSQPLTFDGSEFFTPGEAIALTGTGAVGDLLTLTLPNRDQATVRIGTDGTWSHAFDRKWVAAPYAITVRSSLDGTVVERTYSPAGSKALAFDGPSTFTPGAAMTLSGTGAIGDRITLTLPTSHTAAVEVGADGTWSHTFDRTWAAAPHSVTARSSLTGATAERTYNPANSKPFAFDGPFTFTPGTAIALSGTGAAGDSVTLTLPTHHTANIRVATDGTWSHTFDRTWTATEYEITARSSLTGETATGTFAPEATDDAAALQITSGTEYTKGQKVTVSGKNTPGKAVELRDAKGTFLRTLSTNAAGEWTFTTGGAYTQDSVTWKFVSGGQTMTKTFTGVAAEQPAPLTVTSDTNYTKGERITVSGKNTPGAAIKLHDTKGVFLRTITTNAAGDWTFTTGGAYTQDSVTWKFVSGDASVTKTFMGK